MLYIRRTHTMASEKKSKVLKQAKTSKLNKGQLAKTVGGETIVRLVRDRGFG